MKKLFKFHEDFYNNTVEGVEQFINLINPLWKGLNSYKPLTIKDLNEIIGNRTWYVKNLGDECYLQILKDNEFERYPKEKRPQYESDIIQYEYNKRIGRFFATLNKIPFYCCSLHKIEEGWVKITDNGLIINKEAIKESAKTYITNKKQEEALQLMEELRNLMNKLYKEYNIYNPYYCFDMMDFHVKKEYQLKEQSKINIIESLADK